MGDFGRGEGGEWGLSVILQIVAVLLLGCVLGLLSGYVLSRRTEQEQMEMEDAKSAFAAELRRTPPVKQVWQAAEWIVARLAKWLNKL